MLASPTLHYQTDYFEGIIDQMGQVPIHDNKVIVTGDLNCDCSPNVAMGIENPTEYVASTLGLEHLITRAIKVTLTSSTFLCIIMSSCCEDHTSAEVIHVP